MSKLEELINKLCPNGVEFKKIIEITTWDKKFNGIDNSYKKIFKHISAEQLKKFNSNSGNIKLLSTGIFDGYAEEEKCKEFINEGDVLTLPSGGTANIKYFSGKFLDSGNIIAITRDEKKYNIKYIYYNLINIQSLIQSFYRGSGVKHPDMANILNISIPVPPLEVQCEIVRILDNFTLLSAELSARQKQYEYYKEKLLNDDCEGNYVRLGDITKVITKGTTPKKFTSFGINFIKTEAFDGININKDKLSFVDEEAHITFLKRSILEENDILFTIAGSIGKMAVVSKNLLPANTNQALAIIRLKDNINTNYIKFILQSSFMKKYIKKCVKGSAQPNLNLQQLNDFIVPFPNNEKQIEIMNILEKFEKLCNDLSEGLPAEIEARKKQYEFYRDKLLTFKEPK
ncbi:restriction endonuclease subunit S [Campylobacter hyointestinalis]|uniref:restriction endonuclease subunit S n=1 Tax=Campylobacter hyointestinalis TaxID=198 RepID=UPI000DCB4763|nr:restriction endonuclease subunit S [Campylobacter hyointestinalis]RAZ46546.1 restriction endonuclease subunit S [Campylobacter hyointestinalis subsp. lawsonii]